MANTYTTLTGLFSAIANAIRAKTGGSAQIVADDFPTEIGNIPTGAAPVIESLSVTENGTYAPPSGVDGYGTVTVSVPVTGLRAEDSTAYDFAAELANGNIAFSSSVTAALNG